MEEEKENLEAISQLTPVQQIEQIDEETIEKKKTRKREKNGSFQTEWVKDFPFLKEFKLDDKKATRKACNTQLNVYYGGRTD
ncbi:unnamed protein product, partial [Didymodactylos carnosus]